MLGCEGGGRGMTLIDFCFFQARSKRDVGYFYTARYKEIQDDWNADYEADESQLEVPETLGVASSDDDDDDDDGDDEEELFSASPEDEALADQELKSIVTRLLHNDSDFLTLNENIFLLYLRLMDVEAELNRSVAAVVQEAFETTDLPFITTTKVYVETNPEHNSEVNRLLNRLVYLRFTRGLVYLKVLKSIDKALKFSSESELDSEVRNIFVQLKVLAALYGLDFKQFLADLETATVPKKPCPVRGLWKNVVCSSKFLAGIRKSVDHCCPKVKPENTRVEL